MSKINPPTKTHIIPLCSLLNSARLGLGQEDSEEKETVQQHFYKITMMNSIKTQLRPELGTPIHPSMKIGSLKKIATYVCVYSENLQNLDRQTHTHYTYTQLYIALSISETSVSYRHSNCFSKPFFKNDIKNYVLPCSSNQRYVWRKIWNVSV